MKNQLKNLVFFLTFFFSSCQKDLYEDKVTDSSYNYPNAPFKSKMVNIHDVPNIENYINFNGSNPANKTGELTNELTDAIFAENSVIETIDEENNKNYSIAFIYEDTPKGVFYNFIVNVLPNGEQKAHIVKLNCDPSVYENFKAHNFEIKHYNGITEMNTFNADRNIADDPCPKILIPSPSTPGSPGTGSLNDPPATSPYNTIVLGYNTSAGSGIMSVTIGETTYYAGGGVSTTGGGSQDHSGCYGSNGEFWYFYQTGDLEPPHSHNHKTGEDDPCPPEDTPTGYVPVNNALLQLTHMGTLYNNPPLTKWQKIFLANHPETLNSLYTELMISGADAEDRNFIREAIDALMNDAEVDIPNRVIIDKTLKENPCVYGVYTQMGKAPAFKDILQSFNGEENNAVNLIFKVGVPAVPFETSNAITLPPENYLITILINPLYLNRPRLDIARTFIHEIIHADIYRKLLSLANQGSIPLSVDYINGIRNDFPLIVEYYMKYKYGILNGTPSIAQHELMAQHYRDTIINALIQFDNAANAYDLYNALAWTGLMGEGELDPTTFLPPTPTVAWSNVPLAERDHIVNLTLSYKANNPPCQP